MTCFVLWSRKRSAQIILGLIASGLSTLSTNAQPQDGGLQLPRQATVEPDTIPIRSHLGQVEVGGLVSTTSETPYWLHTNQFGVFPKTAPTGLLIASMRSDYRYQNKTNRFKPDWGYGLEVVGQTGAANRVILSEAFLKLRIGFIELSGGRRKEIIGLAQSRLSSGSFIWSGNALPMPKVELSIPEYLPLGFTKGWLALKGSFAHGWFGNGTFVQGSYLHQKALFFRVGKPNFRVRLYGLFTHQAQWAGYAPFLERDPTSSFQGQLANSFVAYMNVVVPLKTDALKNLAKFTTYDQNRVGDHRGSAEAAVEFRLNHGTILAYQQHFYDLGRKLYNLRNIEDGLYGIQYTNTRPHPVLAEALVELFNSGNQGVLQFGKALGGEWENYFINGQYPDGWSYQGRTLGTPFISQTEDVNPSLPSIPVSSYTLDNQLISGKFGINNNRIWALHAGAAGNISRQWGYVTKVTYSKNYGLFSKPFPSNTNQLSCLLSITRTISRRTVSTLIASIGYDQGSLLKQPQQLGGYLAWRKAISVSRN